MTEERPNDQEQADDENPDDREQPDDLGAL